MRENQHVQPIIDETKGTVTFKFAFGQPDYVFDINKCDPSIIARAALAGMAQVRLVDRAAVSMTDDEGNIIPEAERVNIKRSRIVELGDHYMTGSTEWSIAGSGGGGRSITIEAIARVKETDYDTAKAYVEQFASVKRRMPDGKEMSFGGDVKKALAYLRTGKAVSEAIAQIRAERMPAAKLDADAALAELGG